MLYNNMLCLLRVYSGPHLLITSSHLHFVLLENTRVLGLHRLLPTGAKALILMLVLLWADLSA